MEDHTLFMDIISPKTKRLPLANRIEDILDECNSQFVYLKFLEAFDTVKQNVTCKLIPLIRKNFDGWTKRKNEHINFMFDLNSEDSFSKMTNLVDQFKDRLEISQLSDMNQALLQTSCSMCIVGTKCDLERKVSEQQITQFLNSLIPPTGIPFKQLRIQYYEISSKQDHVIDPITFSLATYNPAAHIRLSDAMNAMLCVK